jgi:hypothetical protein
MTLTRGAGPKRPWKLRAIVFAAAVALPSSALAERARVALAQPAEPDEIQAEVATRIRAELETALFEVVVVPLDPGMDPRQGVESAAIDPKPLATVAIVRLQNRPAVDVWISDRLTGKTLVKRVDVGRKPDTEITSALAIHAVELLRASLLEVRTQSRPDATPAEGSPSPIPNEVVDWVDHAIRPPAFQPLFARPTIAVGAATIYGSPAVGAAFAPVLRASIGASSGVAARLSFVGPAFSGRLRGPRGSASVRQELAMVEVAYAPSRQWLMPMASAGIGGYHLDMRGDATDPAYTGGEGQFWALLADIGAGIAARLGPGAALSLEAHGFITQPTAHLFIGDTSIATVGRSSLLVSLGIVAGF